MLLKKVVGFAFVVIASLLQVPAQTAEPPKDSSVTNVKLIALPLLFYSPDTKLGLGAAGMMTFNLRGDTSRLKRSSVQLGFAYTTMKQVLFYAPYQLFTARRRYWISGEIGYYNYVYNYFGIGNDVPQDYIEKYTAKYPRLRIGAMRLIAPSLYFGLTYAFDDYRIIKTSTNGLLGQAGVSGYNGGRISAVGIAANFDTRDNIHFPSQGWFIESEVKTDQSWTGSSFQFTRLHLNVMHYWSLRPKHILAVNAAMTGTFGVAPFFQYATLGGSKRLRGYYEGKYREKHAALLQAEYRSPFWWRLGAVAFAGIGAVSGQRFDFESSNLRYNYGGGIRFLMDKKQRINLRLDYGCGYKSSGFYFTIGEAF